MAEEKPFEPTASRLARARREGDVARSSDVNALAALAGGVVALAGTLGPLASASRTALAYAAAGRVARGAYVELAACAISCAVVAGACAVTASLAQSRGLRFAAPALKFERLDPIAGLRRIGSRDALFSGAKALGMTMTFGALLAAVTRDAIGAGGVAAEPSALASRTLATLGTACGTALAAGLVFAGADLALERRRRRRRLRMSFAELKRELRQTEGDPHVRGRRRNVQRSLARASIARLREAAFVIANPEHVAIAFEYRPPVVPVPRVLLRALDAAALEVKRRARELRVPVVVNVSLARALLAATRPGDFIPPGTYAAVAAVVAALVRDGLLPEGSP